uniref:Uncharacterized protein n=1 Tax=Pyxicephalus adspersus TaxID=30357 RepID=A0AAV3AF00_PYXAD|nr:TPA: hypothetical protein GDO54_011654 [Pyxicephalus adspersus]
MRVPYAGDTVSYIRLPIDATGCVAILAIFWGGLWVPIGNADIFYIVSGAVIPGGNLPLAVLDQLLTPEKERIGVSMALEYTGGALIVYYLGGSLF